MKVVVLAASPRIGGNSETLVDETIRALEESGAEVVKIRTHTLDFIPCISCGKCETLGKCAVDDSFQEMFDLLIECDGMVFASPLYFMNVPGRGKALIDRCQAFWAAKNKLKLDLFGGRKRFGFLIACAGKKFGKDNTPVFRGIEDTMKTLFSALGIKPLDNLLVSGVENKGDICDMPSELNKAYVAGRKMATALKQNGID